MRTSLKDHGSDLSKKFDQMLDLLKCPATGQAIGMDGTRLVSTSGEYVYPVSGQGIATFANDLCSDDAVVQREHYDRVALQYSKNLTYPHTIAYMGYLDDCVRKVLPDVELGDLAEICCGTGEAFTLLYQQFSRGIGVDISTNMLAEAQSKHADQSNVLFVQGDATRLPLTNNAFDTIIMLGGIHHVNDRQALFDQVFQALKPGGRFVFREPLDDFFLWRLLRYFVYRISPALDHKTERPLRYVETVPLLEMRGFKIEHWNPCGFLGFCIFMNSDILVFNRLFRFIPGIARISRFCARFDECLLKIPGLRSAGLQVVSTARKPYRS